MTKDKFEKTFLLWLYNTRQTAVAMGFADEELVPWLRQNYEIVMEIFLAQVEVPEPTASVNLFLMKGWDPQARPPEPEDGSVEVQFEPEDKP